MSMNSIPLSELGSGAPAAKFANIGDTYVGRITAMAQRQQTDPVTNQVKTFVDGSPRMQWVITIEQANGESVSLWARGGKSKAAKGTGETMLNAIGSAVRAAGASAVDVGGELAVAYTGESEAALGLNPSKLFSAQYRPPSQSIPVDLFAQ